MRAFNVDEIDGRRMESTRWSTVCHVYRCNFLLIDRSVRKPIMSDFQLELRNDYLKFYVHFDQNNIPITKNAYHWISIKIASHELMTCKFLLYFVLIELSVKKYPQFFVKEGYITVSLPSSDKNIYKVFF